MRVLGIDEAGRGCVLGDLVIGGFVADDVDELDLRAAGAGDSKAMSHARRLQARATLEPLGAVDVRRVTAARIDAGNLNALEEEVIADLVRTWKPDVVIVDALGHPNTLPALRLRLEAAVGGAAPETWIIEPKADANHGVVGAASIFAKTERDAALDRIREAFGEVGSGYPSDPKTRRWLADWARTGAPWPPFVRTRWQTVAALAQQDMLA